MEAPGMHPDGDGLYLQVGPGGTTSWIFDYMLHGKARYMGLGSRETVSVAAPRKRAIALRALCNDGIDPIDGQKT